MQLCGFILELFSSHCSLGNLLDHVLLFAKQIKFFLLEPLPLVKTALENRTFLLRMTNVSHSKVILGYALRIL